MVSGLGLLFFSLSGHGFGGGLGGCSRCGSSFGLSGGGLVLGFLLLSGLLSILLCSEAISLLTALLQLKGELIVVLLEVGGRLHHDLECWVGPSLDPDDLDIVPAGEDIDDLSEAGHAAIAVAPELKCLVLVSVEDVLDEADVGVDGEAGADRQHIAEVLLSGLIGGTLASLIPLTIGSLSLGSRGFAILAIARPTLRLAGPLAALLTRLVLGSFG